MKASWLFVLLSLVFCNGVSAQEPAPPAADPSPPPPSPTGSAVTTPADTREQTIYVPFEKLEDVFENQERGVFLPYREFLELWNKLHLPDKLKQKEPPVEGVLASASYRGKVVAGVAELNAKLSFEALKDGWSQLKLGTGELSIAEAKSTALLNFADGGYEILFPQKGAYTLEARILGGVTREQGRSALRLKLPKTAVSQFELNIPDKGLDFVITPASAYSAVENADRTTSLIAYFGASQEVLITWQRKGGETALAPLLFAEAATTVRIAPGAVRTEVIMTHRILRAGVNAFDLLVPADQQVLSVEGQDLREWKLSPEAGGQKLHIDLHTPARESHQLRITLEAALAALPQQVKLPVVQAQGVERQSGAVSVFAEGELVAEVADLQGLTQQASSVKEQRGLVGQFRYLRLPYAGTVAVSEAQPQIEVASETLLEVETDLLRLTAQFIYRVKKAGIFSAQIELPPGFPQAEASGEAVESSAVLPANGKAVLHVKFSARQTGSASFKVTAEAPRAKPDEPVAVPVLTPQNVARHEATVGLAIHVSLKPATADKGDLREEDIRNLGSLPIRDRGATPLTLAFRYRGTARPAQVQFELQKPRVSAEVATLLDVREAVIHHSWTLAYTIDFAAVSELAIEVPKEIADDLRIEGDNIKERIKSEAKDAQGQPTGAIVWRVVLQNKVLGPYALLLFHETARGEVKPGVAAPVTLHEIKPLNLFRETGQVAVLKDGNLEFTKTDAKGLELIDPKELRGGLQRDGVFLAYKYAAHPLALRLDVSKNFYLEVPQAVVSHAVLTSVIAEDEAETTEVIYWVRNNSQQFFSIQLPVKAKKNARLLSDAFVNGEPQQPSKRPDKNELLIRLPSRHESNEAFPVRFVYEVPSPHPGRRLGWRGTIKIEPPLLGETKVLQTRWSLHVPADYRYVKFGGAMREDTGARGWDERWRLLQFFVPQVGPEIPGSGPAMISDPPPLPAPKNAGFDTQLQKDGTLVVLHRLDAPAPVAASYRGKAYAATIEAFFCVLAFFGGVRLLRASARTRFTYFMGIGVGALIVSGAVNPRAAGFWQAIYAGVLLAALVWLAAAFWNHSIAWRERLRARRAAILAARAARAATPPPINPPTPETTPAS